MPNSTPRSPCNPIGYKVSYVVAGTHLSPSPDVVKYVNNSGGTPGPNFLPTDSRVRIGNPALSDGSEFQAPNMIFLDSGVELGPMLFIVPPDYNQLPLLRVDRVGVLIFASWPLWATNFILETSSTLGAGESWGPWTTNPAISGATVISKSPMDKSGFFRLRRE